MSNLYLKTRNKVLDINNEKIINIGDVLVSLTYKQGDEIKIIKAWICNTQNRSSVIFEEMENVDDYDVFIPYHFNGEKYFYSMYTFKDNIKCNQISILSDEAPHTDVLLTFNGHDDAAGANSEKFAFSK